MVLIFDLDGTLVDSSKLLSNSINFVRGHFALPPLSKDDIMQSISKTNINLRKYFYHVEEVTPKHRALFYEYYTKNAKDELKLFDGAKEFLERLQKDFTLTLATNAYKESTLTALKTLKIGDFFTMVVCGNEVKEPKPSPLMIEKILTTLKCQEALFIGDGDTDKEAAKKADIPFIRVDFLYKKNGISSFRELENKIYSIIATKELR